MTGTPGCWNRRQILAATGSAIFLSGCIDTGSDTPSTTTLDEFETVDVSQVPATPTVTKVESGASSITVTIEGSFVVGTPCTELIVERNPYLSHEGEYVFVEIGGRETDDSCPEEVQHIGFRLVFTVRDVRPETVYVSVDTVSELSHSLEIPYPENQTDTATT